MISASQAHSKFAFQSLERDDTFHFFVLSHRLPPFFFVTTIANPSSSTTGCGFSGAASPSCRGGGNSFFGFGA